MERTGYSQNLTFRDIDGKSYTLTGADDNYTALSGAMQYLDKSKVVASERLTQEEADNLTAVNGSLPIIHRGKHTDRHLRRLEECVHRQHLRVYDFL